MYENGPGIMQVEDIFGKYLDLMSQWQRPDREDVLKFICECFRHYYPGNMLISNSKLFYEPENIQKVTDALYAYMKKRMME